MPNPKTDNPFLRLDLTLADLCYIGGVKGPTEIRPEHAPLLIGTETTVEHNDKTGVSKTVSRYCVVLPGSGFMKVIIKVEEPAPSITQEAIDRFGGAVRVNIQGFSSGSFETNGGGARPYFKAAQVTPIQAQPNK
ncbi:MAG: hypothetical protein HDT35_08620 [Clostridiales bacterium]|nr:hypothetical protein [Clostridiales bacterium]